MSTPSVRPRLGQMFSILAFLFVAALLAVLGYRLTPPDGTPVARVRFGSAGRAPVEKANLALVTIDGLRADRVRFGTGAPTPTPHLARLAGDAFRFEQALTAAPLSFPAHSALMTGRIPRGAGGLSSIAGSLPGGYPTLAEILRSAGFRTAAFVGSGAVGRVSGLARGFDRFDEPECGERPSILRAFIERPAGEVVGAARGWLDENFRHRFFLWVQLSDPLAPYRPPASYDRRFDDPYDGELAYVDAEVGRLLDRLAALGVLGNTIVVVSSSHGLGLGDHGERLAGLGLYDSTIVAPALLRVPGRSVHDRTIPEQVRFIDFLPTLIDLLGVESPPGLDGRSLVALLDPGGNLPALPAYSQTTFLEEYLGGPRLRSLRLRGWKYIEGIDQELYDLARDPGERRDLSASQTGRTSEMRRALHAMGGAGENVEQGAAPWSRGARALLEDGLEALRAGDGDRAVRALEGLVRDAAPPVALAALLGAAQRLVGRPERAMPMYQGALAPEAGPGPATGGALWGLLHAEIGACQRLLGDVDGAIDSYRLAIAALPDDPETRLALASLYLEAGEASQAVGEFHAALARSPAAPRVLAGLGRAYLADGAAAAAVRPLQEAIRVSPAAAPPYFDLARAYEALDRRADAARAYREYVSRVTDEDPIGRGEVLKRLRVLEDPGRRR